MNKQKTNGRLFIRYLIITVFIMVFIQLNGVTHTLAIDEVNIIKISEQVVDGQGLNFSSGDYGLWPNSAGQFKIITYNHYQYTTYYNASRHVCIARRKLSPLSAWQVIEFTDYDYTTNDTHNTVQLGICRGDGTVHLAFDHHVSNLHYRKSVLGAAANPDSVIWNASLFSAITSTLITGITETNITYPTFVDVPNGDMKLVMRTNGGSSDADTYIYTYSAGSHSWIDRGIFISRLGDYEGNAYRNAYTGSPITYGDDGRLYVSWMWRETTDPLSNHDLLFIYSDDNGYTWRNSAGVQIGRTGNNAVNINTSGINAWAIPDKHGLMNNAAAYLDSAGVYHVILSHAPLNNPDYATWAQARADSTFYHYWRGTDGVWHQSMISGIPLVDGLKVLFDKNNNAYLVYVSDGRLYITTAAASSNWTDWRVIYSDASGSYETPSIDYERWKYEEILSLFVQDIPTVNGAASSVRSMDFKVSRSDEPDEENYVVDESFNDGTASALWTFNGSTGNPVGIDEDRIILKRTVSSSFASVKCDWDNIETNLNGQVKVRFKFMMSGNSGKWTQFFLKGKDAQDLDIDAVVLQFREGSGIYIKGRDGNFVKVAGSCATGTEYTVEMLIDTQLENVRFTIDGKTMSGDYNTYRSNINRITSLYWTVDSQQTPTIYYLDDVKVSYILDRQPTVTGLKFTNGIEDGSFSFQSGEYVEAATDITNNTNSNANPVVIIALYNEDNSLRQMKAVDKEIQKSCSDKISVGFILPSNVEHGKIKAFVWKDFETFMPLSTVLQYNIK